MSSRLLNTIASLHETRSVDLSRKSPPYDDPIGDEGALALAVALKGNASVTEINLWGNSIGAEGALALAWSAEPGATAMAAAARR
jgi:hypothetical protein